MRRIFSVRINLDLLASSTDLLMTDSEHLDWHRGFLYGLRGGGQRTTFTEAMLSGWEIGITSYNDARELQEKSSQAGRKSVDFRPQNRIDQRQDKQPGSEVPPNVPPRVPPKVPPKVPPNVPPRVPPEQERDREIERLRDREIEQTTCAPEPFSEVPPRVPPKVPPRVPPKVPPNLSSNPDIHISRDRENEQTARVPEPGCDLDLPPSSDADAWRMGKGSEPWAQSLRRAGAKIGPQNWAVWEALVQANTLDTTIAAARSLGATQRWPDATEEVMRKAHGQTPLGAAVARKTITLRSQ